MEKDIECRTEPECLRVIKDKEHLRAVLSQYESEFDKFENIHPDDRNQYFNQSPFGFAISYFSHFLKDNTSLPVEVYSVETKWGRRTRLGLHYSFEELRPMTVEDVKYLLRAGVMYDFEIDCFCIPL